MPSAPESPTKEEWRALYAAAGRFYDLQPWEWLYEDQLFGVVNPEDGEIGYCSIMGNLGEHLALSVYLEAPGFFNFLAMQDAPAESPEQLEAFIDQRALQASFEARGQLSDEDRKVIRQLGLKFRGPQAWPMFRECTPGYLPWYISGAQCRFLTLTLEQACEVASRFRDNPDSLDDFTSGRCLVRVPRTGKKGLTWSNKKQRLPEELLLPGLEAGFAQEDLATWQGQAAGKPRQGAIELDYSYIPRPLQENPGERPFFARQILAVDHKTALPLASEVAPPHTLGAAVVQVVKQLLAEMPQWPRQIEVRRAELAALLNPLEELGIAVVEAFDLPALTAAHESVFSLLEKLISGELPDLDDDGEEDSDILMDFP